MKIIAFDVMGNDNGVEASVKATIEFLNKNKDYKVILVGDENEIVKYVDESDGFEILNVKNKLDYSKGARAARDEDNSMSVSLKLVRDGKADAVISSGDSGIYLSMATLLLKRLNGIKRPAFMPVFPTIKKGKRFVMLDVGANLISTSEMMVQWGMMGNVFSKNILGVKKPKIGVVNIGTEDKKGKDFHIEANEKLKKNKKINYVGFIEPRDLLNGVVDVAITDGYAGNMILKTMEGTVLSLLKLIKGEITSKFKYKIGGLLAKGAFSNVKETLDYRNVGAAWIIGLNGLAIKAHGGSDKQSYLGAFSQIHEALEKNAMSKIKEAINEN